MNSATHIVRCTATGPAASAATQAAKSAIGCAATDPPAAGYGGACVRVGRLVVCRQGFGLLEMMLALAIGALLALAASAILAGAHAGWLRHADNTRLDDSGRQALAIMTRAVRQAGYEPSGAAALTAVRGLDAAGIAAHGDGIDGPWPAAVNGSDVLAVRFTGSGSGDGDGSMTDCAGFAVGEADEGWSIFYVAAGADGDSELRCKYKGKAGWGADAIVRGVDTLQVLYGIDTDDPADGLPNRYLNAAQVEALEAGGAAWRRVASARIALLLHGGPGSDPGAQAATYHLFGRGYSAMAAGSDAGVAIDEAVLPPGQRQRRRRVVSAMVFIRH